MSRIRRDVTDKMLTITAHFQGVTMTYGANPDELEALGSTLQSQIEIVNKIITDVDSPLNSIVWTGPAKDAFKTEWDTNFKGALNKLNDAFGAAGTDCKQRATGVRTVLGTGAG